MDQDDKKMEESNSQEQKEEQSSGNDIFCPMCGDSIYIPDELMEEKGLVCPNCKKEFANPFQSLNKKLVTSSKKKEGSGDKSKNLIYFVVIATALIIAGVWYFSSTIDKSNNIETKNQVIDMNVYHYRDDRGPDRDLLRQCFTLFELHNGPMSSSIAGNLDANGKKSDIFTFKSNYCEVSVHGLDGVEERNNIVYHTFDLGRMVITLSMVLNGYESNKSYPVKSVQMEKKSGHTIYKMNIGVLRVNEIWFSPAIGNLGYEYSDGKQIAYFKVKEIR